MIPLDLNGPDRPFRPFPAQHIEHPAAALFLAAAARAPGKLAIDDGSLALTYGALQELAGAIAAALRAAPGPAPVAIALPMGARFPAAMLAALACGRPYLPLDTGFPEERNAQIVAHARPGVVITDRATAAAARSSAPRLPVILVDDLTLVGRTLEVTATADDLAYILYTSGSTGRPKGVVQNQRGLLHDVMQYVNSVHLDAGDRLTQLYSPSVNGAIRDIYGALLTGGTLHPVDLRREGLRRLRGLLLDGSITILHAMPPVFRAVQAALAGQACPPAVRLVYLAGDRIFTGDVARFRAATAPGTLLYVGIGSTENATIYRQWFLDHRTPVDGNLLPVGYPVPDRASVLLAEDGTPARPGEVGEIVVTSRYMALGYWNEPELTGTAFRPSPSDPAARVFHTGDLGRLRADGLLEFVGRRDRQLKIRGYRVEPAETEAALRAIPGVTEAAVIGRSDGPAGPRLVAFAAPAPSTALDGQSLAARLAMALPAHQRPRTIHVVPALPTLPNLKHDLPALGALDDDLEQAPPEAVPVNPNDEIVTAIRMAWEQMLGVGSFASGRTFAEAGGDSLSVLRFLLALEERLGRSLPPDATGLDLLPAEIAARLARPERSQGTRLFIIPGTSGGSATDLRLAAALAPAFRAEVVPLPTLDEEWRGLPGIDALARICAERILARAPDGPVALLGLSFGGRLAWATAARLLAAGREIAFLGLDDIAPRAGFRSFSRAASRARHYLGGPRCLRRFAIRTYHELIYQCVRRKVPALGRISAGALAPLLTPGQCVILYDCTLGAIRRAKILDWQPSALPLAVTLFKTTETARRLADLPDHLGWADLCDELRVVSIEGGHGGYYRDGPEAFAASIIEAAAAGRSLPRAA